MLFPARHHLEGFSSKYINELCPFFPRLQLLDCGFKTSLPSRSLRADLPGNSSPSFSCAPRVTWANASELHQDIPQKLKEKHSPKGWSRIYPDPDHRNAHRRNPNVPQQGCQRIFRGVRETCALNRNPSLPRSLCYTGATDEQGSSRAELSGMIEALSNVSTSPDNMEPARWKSMSSGE